MPYRVIETLTNETDITYNSLDDFINECIFNGYPQDDVPAYWADKLMNEAGGTEEEKNAFLNMVTNSQPTYDSWDASTQSCIKTSDFDTESDYLIKENVRTAIKPTPSDRFSTVLVSKQEV